MADGGPAPERTWRDNSLVQLTLVRYREFFREPEALFWVFIFPILLAAGLGIAFRNRPAAVTHVAVAGDSTESLVKALKADPALDAIALDDSAAALALRTGRVALVVRPVGRDSVEFRYDDTRPEGQAARLLVDRAVQRAAGRPDPVGTRDALIREPGSRYIDFVVPGLLGMNLMGSGIWGIGFAVVEARRKKLLKRLIATPMSRVEYLASFLLSRLTMLTLEVALLLGFGVIAFGVPLRGSWGTLAVICLLASLCFGGLGLLIASRPKTIEGASGLMNLVMLPMWIFSGVFFASSNFPNAFQPFIKALPLTATIDALRANMLEGATLSQVAPELGIIGAWLLVSFVVAVKIFRWK
jgi:ABC-type polysaccharide/polyol phosphate export permease